MTFQTTKNSLYIRNKNKESIEYMDIIYIEGATNYSIIHLLNGQKVLYARTLKYLSDKITQECSKNQFFRIHRSFYVNLEHLHKYAPWTRTVELSNGHNLQVARRKKSLFEQRVVLGNC
jgi:two-component system LytT family response regulator